MRLAFITAALVAAAALPASAAAQGADIEGVWTFNGGQVAVQPEGDAFVGTVIRPTQFARCPHQNGERMWIDVRRQADGQYWGKHQYLRDSDCGPAARGNTAYRVLSRPDGTRYLRVCFSSPGSTSQPKIAPDGTATDNDDGCHDSDFVRALPQTTPTVNTIATLPRQGSKRCLSRRRFTIRLKEPPGDALATASVYVNGRRVQTRSGERITAPINLRGLPKGRYTVRIVARTVLGRTIRGSRRYRTCTPKRSGTNTGPV